MDVCKYASEATGAPPGSPEHQAAVDAYYRDNPPAGLLYVGTREGHDWFGFDYYQRPWVAFSPTAVVVRFHHQRTLAHGAGYDYAAALRQVAPREVIRLARHPSQRGQHAAWCRLAAL